MSIDNSHQISDVKVMISQGADGVGIESIEKTSSQGIEDTYTITLTDGRKSVFTVTNGNGIDHIAKTGEQGLVDEYTIYFDDNSTYVYYVTNGQGGGMSAELLITSDAGSTITVTNPSGQTIPVSQVTGSTTEWTCSDTQYGTYVVESTLNSDTVTVNVAVDACKIYSVNALHRAIPDGSTVMPTDDIQTWLNCADIWDKSYTTLDEVLADTDTLVALMANDNAVDYLVRSTTWAVPQGLVPVMTSNTTPSGECFGSTNFGSTYDYYKAFDGDDTTRWSSAEGDTTGSFVGYHFTSPVCVNKVSINTTATSTAKIQGSNDGTTYTDLATINISTAETLTDFDIVNSDSYSYYRFYVVSASGTGYCSVYTLQFYSASIPNNQTAMSYIGLNNYCANTLLADNTWLNAICNSTYFESVLNVKVPTMTSNTTPSGECIASSVYNSSPDYQAWKAFDGNVSTKWLSGAATSDLSYSFTNPKKIMVCIIDNDNDYNPTYWGGGSGGVDVYGDSTLLGNFTPTANGNKLIFTNNNFNV